MVALPNLNYLDDPFAEAEEMTGGGSLPDGDYECMVDEVEIKQSEERGTMWLNWKLKVSSPEEFAGRFLFHTNSIPVQDTDPEKAKTMLGMLKADLKAVGVKVEHERFRLGAFLKDQLSSLLDKPIAVSAKTKKDNKGQDRQNTYFKREKEGASTNASTSGATSTASTEVSDAPFDPFADE